MTAEDHELDPERLCGMSLNEIEEEVILLRAVEEFVDSMVNFEMLDIYGTYPDSNILFTTSTHQKLFNIILVDFLSRTDKKGVIKCTSFVSGLKHISKKPNFEVGGSVDLLRRTTHEFSPWLEEDVEVDIWMPSLDKQAVLRLSRVTFLKMCGDISKHNFLRAVGVAKDLKEVLCRSGVNVDLEDALLALPDFYERFHTDILNYHASTIAAFLNDIRWGIYEYLQPEIQHSLVWTSHDPPNYRYTYPDQVNSKFARECYWQLMNEVRRPPYVRRFEVTKWLKLRY